ncbi:PREDICTED: nudix hydrolase 15, mitochondrial-like isoform X2 [Populus euphratica]|uniref:Nudix hydrolase 15, mitochondrial-like isoform X2 n=1 Tax=Populus euphratica TaxID=75702 RepID=A0AAJ6Y8X4_POPEU|nr:PREDICTED: nudix hydrolase 15, mitochondrial-like isoform X2 [Populus euphratica]
MINMACITVPSTCMENAGFKKGMFCGSQTLQKIAEQLQFLTPPRVNTMEVEHFDDNTSDEFCLVNWRKKRAAVLICLFEGNEGELRVILTKRSMKLSSHPGDVALPGGKMEEGDVDDSATALREAMEEIGLDPHLVQVVANLEPFISQHQLKVVPVVGLLARVEDFKPVLNTDEVDTLFDVPLEMFLKEENHRWEEKEWMGWNYSLHLFDFESEKGVFLIWGLTASILIEAASVIYQRPPCFEHHLRDFQQLQKALNNNSIA